MCRTGQPSLQAFRVLQLGLAVVVDDRSPEAIAKHVHQSSESIARNRYSNVRVILYERKLLKNTYSSQSTAMMRETSSAGRPTVSSTITSVTKPAWGIPAAPILAAVAVILIASTLPNESESPGGK